MTARAAEPGAVLGAAARAAAAQAADAAPARRVHDARVAGKRLRAQWRLLRGVAGKRACRARCRALSRAARVLAEAREREALRAVARDVARAESGRLAERLREFLRTFPPPPSPAALAGPLKSLQRELDVSAAALARTAAPAGARLDEGLERLKRRLSRAAAAARRGGEDQAHECRKRAKDLQYALEALGAAPARALKKAGAELGEARDLRRLAWRARLPRTGALSRRARRLERSALARLRP